MNQLTSDSLPCRATRLRGLAVALVVSVSQAALLAASPVQARSNDGLSGLSAVSALPIASVASAASVAVTGTAASVGLASVPVALSVSGATLVVRSVESTARGMICALERTSDGALATLEFIGNGAERVSLIAGRSLTVSVVGAGAVLSAAGELVAFVPNELGRALMHNERVTW